MELYTKKAIGEYQANFRYNRSTMDQFFTVQHILRKCWEYGIDIYQLFVDFKQTYDRKSLYCILLDLEIPQKLVRLTTISL